MSEFRMAVATMLQAKLTDFVAEAKSMGFSVAWDKDAGFSVQHGDTVNVAALPLPEALNKAAAVAGPFKLPKKASVTFVADKCPKCQALLTSRGNCKRCYMREYHQRRKKA